MGTDDMIFTVLQDATSPSSAREIVTLVRNRFHSRVSEKAIRRFAKDNPKYARNVKPTSRVRTVTVWVDDRRLSISVMDFDPDEGDCTYVDDAITIYFRDSQECYNAEVGGHYSYDWQNTISKEDNEPGNQWPQDDDFTGVLEVGSVRRGSRKVAKIQVDEGKYESEYEEVCTWGEFVLRQIRQQIVLELPEAIIRK